jgi:hypothetical protein
MVALRFGGSKTSGLRRTRGGGGGGGRGAVRVAWCPRFQKVIVFFSLVWLVYVMGILFIAAQVHKLDPAAPPKTNDTEQNSNQRAAEISPHHVAVPPKEVLPKKLEQLLNGWERKNQRTKEEPAKKPTDDQPKKEEKKKKDDAKHKPNNRRHGFKPNPHAYMVNPEVLMKEDSKKQMIDDSPGRKEIPVHQEVLTAYLEPIDQSTWDTKPLPVRTTTAEDLTKRPYPKLNSCSKLPEQWPVDEYPDADPFLPWIHDVFPTDDGKFIQFVAQNKRRCRTGSSEEEEVILKHMAPQVALLQHVPLKKLLNISTTASPRYRLASHEEADPESVGTRFICKFKPSGDITFSEYNNDYEWVSYRKSQQKLFSQDGRDNKQIHTSQLLFRCPVPDHLMETVKSGSSVKDDWATLFIDLIPVRTPPRFTVPAAFLVPRYQNTIPKGLRLKGDRLFDPYLAWGDNHVLPAFEDSGRWENIPICKPSLMTYEPEVLERPDGGHGVNHNLVSCLWASTGYSTRGNRFAINDGQRRLLEWITFNKILGFDHFYIYDNSAAFTNESSLQPIADMFPGDVTVVKWPSQVCNNNPNNVDSVGERSSQYAAESSCRLRFGPHVKWILMNT